ncbi:hypothetical protein [Streptomyces griseus]|uniref:hypothetical protein n=1 Tax=Streptomyces griseus TaxID=1911 RepID=UPI0008403C30|nr:hypothetical protein [Streptomyces griseus]
MGAVREVVKNLGPETADKDDQKHLVNALAQLASAKADFFETQIKDALRTAGSPENQTLPVEAVIDWTTETHAYSSKANTAIGDAVGKALKSFCSGSKENILSGVAGLVNDSLSVFLGNAGASDVSMKKYYVLSEGMSIVRLDILAWQLNVEAKGVQTLMEKVSAFVAVKSTVDLNAVKFNTFLNLYAHQLESMKLSDLELGAALDEATKIFNRFHPAVQQSSLAPLRVASQPG